MRSFHLKAYKLIHPLFQQRKYLLQYGRSKNSLTHLELELLQEKFLRIISDKCMADFIVKNIDSIRLLPPAHHYKTLDEIQNIHSEAKLILNN